jgi:hypothetical protein
VESRKSKEAEIRAERKAQEQQGVYKRMSAKEHCDRVKFDPKKVATHLPDSGFKLIYPCEEDLYIKIQKKATEMW